MAEPRSASTRRVFLSYSHLEELTGWPELMLEDYQAIQQDFTYTTDEIDLIDIRVTENEVNITELQDSHYPNLSSQVQFLQQQIDGLPEFTMDTEGFTMDQTEFTMDKVIA